MSESITVMCVDDHPLVRKGLAAILSTESDISLIAEAETGSDAIRLYGEHHPSVTLMDLRLPDKNGIVATQEIRKDFPDARIIALTSYDGDQDIYRALEAGVRGYLLKEALHTDVIRAIRIVHSGKRFIPQDVSEQLTHFFPEMALTPRETEVLSCIADGLGNKEIAEKLGTAVGTIKAHVENILGKLSARDRTHAVTIAVRRGLLAL